MNITTNAQRIILTQVESWDSNGINPTTMMVSAFVDFLLMLTQEAALDLSIEAFKASFEAKNGLNYNCYELVNIITDSLRSK